MLGVLYILHSQSDDGGLESLTWADCAGAAGEVLGIGVVGGGSEGSAKGRASGSSADSGLSARTRAGGRTSRRREIRRTSEGSDMLPHQP